MMMAFERKVGGEDREEETLLGNSNGHSNTGGFSDSEASKRRQCIAGFGVIVMVALVLGTIASQLVHSPSIGHPVSGRLLHDSTENIEHITAAAAGRLGKKYASEGGSRKVIPDENSSRGAVIDRISSKIAEEDAASKYEEAKDTVIDHDMHPEESDIVQGKSINPRFSTEEYKFDGLEQGHGFVWRDTFGVVGALAIFAAFIPQQMHLIKAKDVSSFSMTSLGSFFAGSLCFALFYWSFQATGVALLCLWVSTNLAFIMALKYKYDSKDIASDLPLMGSDQWSRHEVL